MSEITPAASKVHIWRERIEEQGVSGKTVRAFCEGHQISPHTFHYWKKKLRDIVREKPVGRFIAVTSKPRSVFITPRIHLPNGVRIELGEGLESGVVSQFIRSLCGVGHPPKDGYRAKS